MSEIAGRFEKHLDDRGLVMVEACVAVSWLEKNGYLLTQPQKIKEQSDSVQQLRAEIIADYVCAELLISKHSDTYKKVLAAITSARVWVCNFRHLADVGITYETI